MPELDLQAFMQSTSVVALAIIALVVGIQKVLKDWKGTSAETNIITLMHEELERMSKQNTTLAAELNRLQVEIITLNQQLGKLTIENQRLHTEVVALTQEVSRFKDISMRRKV